MTLVDRLNLAETQMDDAEDDTTAFLQAIGLWDNTTNWEYDAVEGALSLELQMGEEPELTDRQREELKRAGFRRVYFNGFGAAARLVLDETQ